MPSALVDCSTRQEKSECYLACSSGDLSVFKAPGGARDANRSRSNEEAERQGESDHSSGADPRVYKIASREIR